MQIENKISIFEKIKSGVNEFYSSFKIYPKFYLTMSILFLISFFWWYASLAYAIFRLSNGFKILGFSFFSSIGTIKFLKIFRYLAVVDNSTVTTLIFPILIACIFYYFHSLFRGKLNKVIKYPTGKYYQIITLPEIIIEESHNNETQFDSNEIQEKIINENKIFKKKLLPIHFPLFHSYRVTFLQLGLIGTLFAMTIAFQETSRLREYKQPVQSTETSVFATEQGQENVIMQEHPADVDDREQTKFTENDDSNFETEDDIREKEEAKSQEKEASDRIESSTKGSAILLSALGTALLSSLMGILVAFIFGPFLIETIGVSIVTNKFTNKMADYSMPEPIDIGNQFEKLNRKIRASNFSFKKLISILGFCSKAEDKEEDKAEDKAEDNGKNSVVEGFSNLNEELYKMNNNFSKANNFIDINHKLSKIILLSEEVKSLAAKFDKIEEKIERMNSENQNTSKEVNKKLAQIDNSISVRVKEVTEQQAENMAKNITIQINEQEKNARNETQALIEIENNKILNEIKWNNTKHEKEYDKLDDKIDKLTEKNQDEIEQSKKKISEQIEDEKTVIQNRFNTLLQKISSEFSGKYSESKEAINDLNKTIKSLSDLIDNSKGEMRQLIDEMGINFEKKLKNDLTELSINLDRKILNLKEELRKNALQMFQ